MTWRIIHVWPYTEGLLLQLYHDVPELDRELNAHFDSLVAARGGAGGGNGGSDDGGVSENDISYGYGSYGSDGSEGVDGVYDGDGSDVGGSSDDEIGESYGRMPSPGLGFSPARVAAECEGEAPGAGPAALTKFKFIRTRPDASLEVKRRCSSYDDNGSEDGDERAGVMVLTKKDKGNPRQPHGRKTAATWTTSDATQTFINMFVGRCRLTQSNPR